MTKAAKYSGHDPDQIKGFVSDIEHCLKQLESERGKYMSRCRSIRDDIKAVIEVAKESGISTRALRSVVKARELERKVDKLRDALEDEHQETYDQIRHCLGDLADTPLGAVVLASADRPESNGEGVDGAEKRSRRRKATGEEATVPPPNGGLAGAEAAGSYAIT